MKAVDERAEEIIRRVADVEYPSVAEIGVFDGRLSRRLLYRLNLHLLMVDPWGTVESSDDAKYESGYSVSTPEDWAKVMSDAMKNVAWAADRVRMYQGTSEDAAVEFADDRFDLVFLDGDHGYEAVSKDIRAWWPKIAPGGWLGGHDYRSDMGFGVVEAVEEWADEEIVDIHLGKNHTWWARKC